MSFHSRSIRVALVSLALLLASQAAWAQCTTFDEGEFRNIVDASQKAIDQDDAYKHKQLWAEFLRTLPCLENQLPKDAWAQFLVAESIVRYTTEKNWEGSLDTALGIWPDVPGVPEFILDEWGPKAPKAPLDKPIPDGTTLFLDGVLVDKPLMLMGLHIVQQLKDGEWDSRMIEDENWPDAWFVDEGPTDSDGNPVAPDPVPTTPGDTKGRAAIGILIGGGNESQTVDSSGTYLRSSQRTGPIGGLSFWGEIPIASVVGLFADAKLPVQIPSIITAGAGAGVSFETNPILLPDAYGGFAVILPEFAIHVGGGITQMQIVEGDLSRNFVFPQPRIAFESVSWKADFLLGGGYTPSASHVDVKATFHVGGHDGMSWRVGPLFEAANAKFVEEKPGAGRTASVFRGRAIVLVSVTWGRPG